MNRRVRYLQKHFPDLAKEPVLDVGCGEGTHLYYFGSGSVGLDGREMQPRSGYAFARWNFQSDISETLAAAGLPRKFKYVWANNVIEHVLSPHEFLLNLRRAMDDDGLLFVGLPLLNLVSMLGLPGGSKVSSVFSAFLAQDHINFFTFKTIKHTVRRAGLDVEAWYNPFMSLKRPPMTGLEPNTVLVLRKNPAFTYGAKADKMLDPQGFLHWKEAVSVH